MSWSTSASHVGLAGGHVHVAEIQHRAALYSSHVSPEELTAFCDTITHGGCEHGFAICDQPYCNDWRG